MIKLVRNALGSLLSIQDPNGDLIEWNFLIKLVNKQQLEGLHLGNKLRLRHLNWDKEKMKIKLATQTFSKCVADALIYLEYDLKDENFQNAGPTATFVQKFNDLFDIFNSRNRFAKYNLKKPFSPATAENILTFIEEMIEYILGLKVTNANMPIIKSSRKTGFIGFLIALNSLKHFYRNYILEKKI